MLEDLLINRYLMLALDRSIEGARNVDAPSGDWREWIIRQLMRRAFAVSERGEVTSRGDRLGVISFHSVDDISQCYLDRPLFRLPHPCPWVTGALGFVSWENAIGVPMDRRFALTESLVEIGWGSVVHHGVERDPLILHRFSLIECTWMFGGLGRGQDFLSRDVDFLQDIADRVNETLLRLGFASRVQIGDEATLLQGRCTPVQFWLQEGERLIDFQGKPIDKPDSLLAQESVDVWGLDPIFFDY